MDRVIKLFELANNHFLANQSKFILSGVSERSLCGELMKHLVNEFEDTEFSSYYVDVEYNRNIGGRIKTIKNNKEDVINITCDIIIHSRGEIVKQDNILALEMKKSTNSDLEKNKDRERLKALTKNTFDNMWSFDGKSLPEHVCRYLLGVYYEINLQGKSILIEYYLNGKKSTCYVLKF